jgi:hypothetical protein
LKLVLIARAGPPGMIAAIGPSRFNMPVRLIDKIKNLKPLHEQSECKHARAIAGKLMTVFD